MKMLKKRTLFIIVTFLTLILSFSSGLVFASGKWINGYMGPGPDYLTETGKTSIGVDLNRKAVVSFYDSVNGDLKLYRSSDHSFETVDSAGQVGVYNSLAMHGNDPRVAYVDSTNARLKYASWNGASWDIEVVDSGNVGFHPSLKLNFRAGGAPIISYYDAANQNLKLASKNLTTSSWHIETVDSAGNVGWNSSLDLDTYNFFPRISYARTNLTGGVADYDLKYAEKNSGPGSGTWVIRTVDTEGSVGEFSSLAMDARYYDLPGISYYDKTLTNLKYAAWNGTSWDIETVDGQYNPGESSSLEIDRNGNPMISYSEHYWMSGCETCLHNTVLKFAHKYDGINWTREQVNSSAGTGHDTDLVLDHRGNPVISHRNTTSTPGMSSVSYSWWVNTGVGSNVVVILGDTSITFDQVSAAGNTTVTKRDTGTPLVDFQTSCVPPTFYDINTTATYSGNIEICFTYDDAKCDESNLMLLHNDGGSWVDVTSSVDTANNVLCGVVSHLSEFVLASEAKPDLIVENLTHSPANPGTRDTITFTAVVKNIGGAQASASTLNVRVGGVTVGQNFAIPMLNPGESFTVQRQKVLRVAQNYQNTATIDPANMVAESNERNNVTTDIYTVTAAASNKLLYTMLFIVLLFLAL